MITNGHPESAAAPVAAAKLFTVCWRGLFLRARWQPMNNFG